MPHIILGESIRDLRIVWGTDNFNDEGAGDDEKKNNYDFHYY